MKDHIHVTRHYIDMEGRVEDVIERIRIESEGLVDAEIHNAGWDYPEFQIVGWRPMTEAELQKAKDKRKREKEQKIAAKKKKEEAERAEYERLKAKFDGRPRKPKA